MREFSTGEMPPVIVWLIDGVSSPLRGSVVQTFACRLVIETVTSSTASPFKSYELLRNPADQVTESQSRTRAWAAPGPARKSRAAAAITRTRLRKTLIYNFHKLLLGQRPGNPQ